MKTAIRELIEKFEFIQNNHCKTLQERIFFDGVLAITETFLEKEKQQIIEAAMVGVNYDTSPFKDANDYYNQTYNNNET